MESNRNAKAKSLRANRGGTRKSGQQKSMKALEVKLIRSYPNQAVWQVWIPGTPTKFTTTVTTGVIAGTSIVNITNISAFATRFSSTFVEYRIIRARFRVRLFSSTNPGVLHFWIDEKTTSAPTLAEATERATLVVSASAIDRQPELSWTAADPVDLAYNGTSTALNSATFKVYSNNANFGSSIVATDYLEIEPMFELQFRGLQGV